MGVYATRLSQVMLAQTSLFEQDKQALNTAAERLEDAAREFDQLKAIESMFGGDTDVAIRDTASKITRVIEATQRDIVTMKNATEDGRLGIDAARQAYQSLPSAQPNLIEQALGTAMKVFVPGLGIIAGNAFLQFVTAAREAERERQAMQALMKLRGDMADYYGKLPSPNRADLSIGEDGKDQNDSSTTSGTGDGSGDGTGPGSFPRSVMDGVVREATDIGAPAINRITDAMASGELSAADRVREAIDSGLNSIAYDEIAGVDSQNGYPGIVSPKSPLPSTDQWPFDVYHPGDINRDGPLQGGYRVNLDASQSEMPRDPMLRSTIEEGKHQLGGQLGALGVSGAALGAGALAVGAARGGGAITGGAVPGGAMGGFAGGAPGAAGGAGAGAASGRGAGAVGGRPMMMGGMAGGAPGAAGGASDKKGQKSGGRLGAGRGGAARAGGGIGAGARGGAAAGARGGMMGGMAGGAQGAGGANDKKSQKSANRLGGGGARGGAAGARGAASGAGARGGAAAGARGGMMGAGMMGAGRGSDEKRERENRSYGSSGVEFFDMSEEQQLDAAGRSGKAGGKVIQVVENDDSRW